MYALDGTSYTSYSQVTDENGQAVFTLPEGSFRFRADENGTQFWSSEQNECTLPGCASANIVVTVPVVVTVKGQAGVLYPSLSVYAFTGDAYTGYHVTTDGNGAATLTLPQGAYRFRADYENVQFWSSSGDECVIPGCTAAEVTLPGVKIASNVTIQYGYDPLQRLTSADYSDGTFFHYTYDSVGNRLSQETQAGTTAYTYDVANRLASVNGVAHSWDANGNLLNDGTNTYAYDTASRLVSLVDGTHVYQYAYNGLGAGQPLLF